jgi:hypothetical protein
MTKAKSELKKHKPANKPESLLVIGDPHSVPDHKCNLEIAELIGKFVAQTNPSLVWCAGDLATFNSLSSYDKGKQDIRQGCGNGRGVAGSVPTFCRQVA